MPIIKNVTTVSSSLGWQSDDGKLKRYDIQLNVEGDIFKCQTYSGQIAEVGWKGDVETYEKKGYTYVRKPQIEGSFKGSNSKDGVVPVPYPMYLSYAKDIAVALIESNPEKKFNLSSFGAIVDAVALAGRKLYESRPDKPVHIEARDLADVAAEVFKKEALDDE